MISRHAYAHLPQALRDAYPIARIVALRLPYVELTAPSTTYPDATMVVRVDYPAFRPAMRTTECTTMSTTLSQ